MLAGEPMADATAMCGQAQADAKRLDPDAPGWDLLLPALRRLDERLSQAVQLAQESYAPARAGEQFRGLYESDESARLLLAREPGRPLLHFPVDGEIAAPPLDRLASAFDLTPFDLDVVLITLAPELDRRYERIYAYLQDNVNLRRPTVDLALHLLCEDAGDRIERRARFAAGGPLVDHGLVRLSPDADTAPLIAAGLKLDEQVVAFLLGPNGLDARLAPHCREYRESPSLSALPLPPDTTRALSRLALEACERCNPLRLHFSGPEGSGRTRAAASLAVELGRNLLLLDLASAARGGDLRRVLQLFGQRARLWGAIPCLANTDAIAQEGLTSILAPVTAATWDVLIVLSERSDLPLDMEMVQLAFGPLAFAEAHRCWQACLARSTVDLPDDDLDELSARLRLTSGQIHKATSRAAWGARWRAAGATPAAPGTSKPGVTAADLYEAACEQSTAELATLARRLRPDRSWNEIVLPDEALAQLRELCARVRQRRRVLDEWGFGRQLSLGRGSVALFTGPPGTGKTLAAEIVASELRLDLCKIDLSSVVSKYIGETEKNLGRIFAAAERANAILFFDEADALFGKRSEVRDSHDRYANVETSYLLQKMEEYDGVAILATNLRQNLDESFIRRIAFTVHFPFPDEASRLEIWRGMWPPDAPLAEDLDLEALARGCKLAGGHIKNIALAAAFLAASEGSPVTMAHLRQATRREYQKLGKALGETELELATTGERES